MLSTSTPTCHHKLPVSSWHTRSRKLMTGEWQWSVGPQTRRTMATGATAQLPVISNPARSETVDKSSALSLSNIREALIRQEDTIIFSLIERAQFAFNAPVYKQDGVPVPGFTPNGQRYSPLEYLLRETEQLHGKIRRYTSPDEHAFYPDDLPALVLPPITYATVLAPFNKQINLNDKVMALYVQHLLPNITASGDDNNYGSSAMYDVLALQALSKRVHYGKFVAEAKFLAQRSEYTELIKQRDRDGIMALLTNATVEGEVIARVRRKAAIFGQDIRADSTTNCSSSGDHYKIDPNTVGNLFRDWVMPLTKEVEVFYLLRRLEWRE